MLQQFLNLCINVLEALGRLETCHYDTFLVNEELGEVPFDAWIALVVGVFLGENLIEDRSDVVVHVPACKSLLRCKELVQGFSVFAVHLDFLETWKFSAVGQFAEFMD